MFYGERGRWLILLFIWSAVASISPSTRYEIDPLAYLQDEKPVMMTKDNNGVQTQVTVTVFATLESTTLLAGDFLVNEVIILMTQPAGQVPSYYMATGWYPFNTSQDGNLSIVTCPAEPPTQTIYGIHGSHFL